MRLPNVLAMAVGLVLLVGTGSALVVGAAFGAGSSGSRHGPAAVTGVAAVAPPTVAIRAGRTSGRNASAPLAPSTSPPSSVTPRTSTTAAPAGLAVPAARVPLSPGADPAQPGPGASAPAGSAPEAVLPTPTASTLPTVTPLKQAVTPDAVVLMSSPLTAAQLAALPGLHGVTNIETVDTGTVQLAGAPVVTFGVDPDTFRAFTPPASASSDQLWQYLAGGSLVSSYDMANDRSLGIGSNQVVTPAGAAPTGQVQGWLGAFASIGLPGVDLLADHRFSSELGLTSDSGLIVSAPGVDGATLQEELETTLPGATVELLHADQVPQNLAGNLLDASTRQKILAAALSRVGLPYVWGAAGPSSFDCSGLVQWAYRQAGVLMPRVAAEQFLTGDHIPLADAQPGDLLFWTYDPSDPGYIDHVAIYLGDGTMVVAPHDGTDVQVAAVPTQDFAGAVQVVLQS